MHFPQYYIIIIYIAYTYNAFCQIRYRKRNSLCIVIKVNLCFLGIVLCLIISIRFADIAFNKRLYITWRRWWDLLLYSTYLGLPAESPGKSFLPILLLRPYSYKRTLIIRSIQVKSSTTIIDKYVIVDPLDTWRAVYVNTWHYLLDAAILVLIVFLLLFVVDMVRCGHSDLLFPWLLHGKFNSNGQLQPIQKQHSQVQFLVQGDYDVKHPSPYLNG